MRGFTLIELLVVIAIITVLAVAVSPALKQTMDGIYLSGTAETIAGQFSLARQTATSRNLPVEMRIYNTGSSNAPIWNLVALVIPSLASGKTADEWVSSVKAFPGNIVIDSGTSATGDSFSTILATGTNTAPSMDNMNPNGPWTGIESPKAPTNVRNLPYVAFRFQPDGSTDLPWQDATSSPLSWCMSLRNRYTKATPGGSTPSANFIAIVIDPITGRPMVFRP